MDMIGAEQHLVMAIICPIHWEGDYEEDDAVDDIGDNDNVDAGFSGWFLTQTPEWLPQLNATDISGADGTPSPEDEAYV